MSMETFNARRHNEENIKLTEVVMAALAASA